MKRETTQTIWRTVVFAGAMLAVPACSKPKPAQTTPANTAAAPDPKKPDTATTMKPDGTPQPDPCAGDDGVGRPRGTDDDGGGGTGRGFVLS